MLDYEEYGSSFRTPRPMRPDGGPANNGLGGDPSNPEGRPRKWRQPNQPQQPVNQAPPQQGAPDAGAPKPQLTFTQMQAQGLPRPPAPTANVMAPGGIGGGGDVAPPQGYEMAPQGNQPVNSIAMPPSGGIVTDPQSTAPSRYSIPMGAGGGSDLQGDIYGDYQTERNRAPVRGPQSRYTGPFSGDTSGGALGSQTEQAIMAALGNPSRYDSNVVKDSYNYLGGAIDDQYNQLDHQLESSIADRGLGAVGDGTIGISDQRYQNLQRRNAKQNLASELLREQANTYGSDRASAIASAMGYGGQKFGQQLGAFNANLGANESNFGQDLQGGNFALNAQNQNYNQRRGALQDYTNFGQQQYQNQYNTNQANQQNQQAQQEFLMKLLGYA